MLARVPDAEDKLYSALRTSFGQDERTGVHLSSLLNPRLTYFRKIDPRPLTDQEIGYFVGGRGHEDIISRLLGQDFELTAEEEIDGIHLRPDFVATTDRIIPKGAHAEFKTRRSNLPKTDELAQTVFQSYRDQIRGYMALKHHHEMYLIVLSLLEGKTKDPLSVSGPVLAVYRETMTDEELMDARDDLYQRKTLLEIGATRVMPLCWEFMCVKWDKGTLKAKCPYYRQCKPYEMDPKRAVAGVVLDKPDDLAPELIKSIEKVRHDRIAGRRT
jgi:hypothetical protein